MRTHIDDLKSALNHVNIKEVNVFPVRWRSYSKYKVTLTTDKNENWRLISKKGFFLNNKQLQIVLECLSLRVHPLNKIHLEQFNANKKTSYLLGKLISQTETLETLVLDSPEFPTYRPKRAKNTILIGIKYQLIHSLKLANLIIRGFGELSLCNFSNFFTQGKENASLRISKCTFNKKDDGYFLFAESLKKVSKIGSLSLLSCGLQMEDIYRLLPDTELTIKELRLNGNKINDFQWIGEKIAKYKIKKISLLGNIGLIFDSLREVKNTMPETAFEY